MKTIRSYKKSYCVQCDVFSPDDLVFKFGFGKAAGSTKILTFLGKSNTSYEKSYFFSFNLYNFFFVSEIV